MLSGPVVCLALPERNSQWLKVARLASIAVPIPSGLALRPAGSQYPAASEVLDSASIDNATRKGVLASDHVVR